MYCNKEQILVGKPDLNQIQMKYKIIFKARGLIQISEPFTKLKFFSFQNQNNLATFYFSNLKVLGGLKSEYTKVCVFQMHMQNFNFDLIDILAELASFFSSFYLIEKVTKKDAKSLFFIFLIIFQYCNHNFLRICMFG